MIIDAIKNGIVIDHISAGKAMDLYQILGLGELDCSVAILKNVVSGKLGRKDIIMDGRRVEKRQLKLPETITNVIRCKNPRCITSVELKLPETITNVIRCKN